MRDKLGYIAAQLTRGGSSFPSKRLDIAPLCHVGVLYEADCDFGSVELLAPAMYMAALPFPGRADGSRRTITDDERGIIVESSLYSDGS